MTISSCAITGHRPTRFKFKYNENNSGCIQLKKRLKKQLICLYNMGVHHFWLGGALGVDMWAAEILIVLKTQPEYSQIALTLALPFDGYDDNWDRRSKERMQLIHHHAGVVVVSDKRGMAGYSERNRYMVDHTDCLLAVYDNNRSIRSGIGMTVHYAEKEKRPIILIHPEHAKIEYINEQYLNYNGSCIENRLNR